MRLLSNLVRTHRAAMARQVPPSPPVAPAPPPPVPNTPLPPPITILQGELKEGQDLGIVKVQDGKLVLDMADFRPDMGTF